MTERNAEDDDALNVLLGSVVHDLRNPLAALVANLGFALKVVKNEAPSPDLREALEESGVACESLRHIVSNLDLLFRKQTKRLPKLEEALLDVAREAVARCRSRAEFAGVELRFECPSAERGPTVDQWTFGNAVENHIIDQIRHAERGATVVVAWRESEHGASLLISNSIAVTEDLRPTSIREPRLGPSSAVGGADRGRASSAVQFAQIAASLGGFDVEIDNADGSSSVRFTVRR